MKCNFCKTEGDWKNILRSIAFEKKTLETMSKDERSLLLFFESRAVDYCGRVDIRRMNTEDMEIAKRWNEEKFIQFGRIVIRHHNSDGTHWCILSEEAWILAHLERKERHKRLWLKKNWLSTTDSAEIYGNPHVSGMNFKKF